MPQAILGGGITPRAGSRIGAGFAHGGYRNATATVPAATATVFNVEGEYTFNQTRLSGEWVRTVSHARPDLHRALVLCPGGADDHAAAVRRGTGGAHGAAAVFRVRDRGGPQDRRAHRRLSVDAEWTVRGGYFRERRVPRTGVGQPGRGVGGVGEAMVLVSVPLGDDTGYLALPADREGRAARRAVRARRRRAAHPIPASDDAQSRRRRRTCTRVSEVAQAARGAGDDRRRRAGRDRIEPLAPRLQPVLDFERRRMRAVGRTRRRR